jgi:hypothetical protein
MKNPMEVLRSKEQELVQVKKEVDALRMAARLLEDSPANGEAKPQPHAADHS